MKLKSVALSLLVIALFTVMGCSKDTASNSGNQSVSTLQKVIQSKKMTAGVILSFPPFGFKDEKGNPQGYDVDMAKEVAKSLGAELTIVDVTADARIPSLETGKVDIVIGNFTRTLERAQKVDFTDPYIVAGERLLVKKGSSIKEIKDLSGKKAAVTKGSTNADIVKKYAPDAEIAYFATSADAVLAVKNGQADAFIEDSNFEQYQAKLNPDLEVVGDSFVPLEYNAFGVKKGDQDWLNYLNLFVFNMNNNGLNKELYQKWFGAELPFKLNPQY
ncbi:ABC transporter substrate-binding protein [Ferviditalea candida]|uniref:Transporter substrate-binding domain-containing protein n=1 Tax=Ferviditalea candida TaxID=3108399 RepID=A0ABU5ZH03_9BACL|nr:transporter substrate-binding domain-containing protein [Paenibacillaceae bacterium T2]